MWARVHKRRKKWGKRHNCVGYLFFFQFQTAFVFLYRSRIDKLFVQRAWSLKCPHGMSSHCWAGWMLRGWESSRWIWKGRSNIYAEWIYAEWPGWKRSRSSQLLRQGLCQKARLRGRSIGRWRASWTSSPTCSQAWAEPRWSQCMGSKHHPGPVHAPCTLCTVCMECAQALRAPNPMTCMFLESAQ